MSFFLIKKIVEEKIQNVFDETPLHLNDWTVSSVMTELVSIINY